MTYWKNLLDFHLSSQSGLTTTAIAMVSPRCARARGARKLHSDRLLLALPALPVEKEEKEEERDEADGVLGLRALSS